MSQPLPQDSTPPASDARPRGKLKMFFGAFPGAGKTNAMLTAARRVRAAGRDVVAGVIDTHGSPDTRTLLEDLEVLPPSSRDGVPARGRLDLDGGPARNAD